MWNENFQYMLKLIFMAVLLRASYELSRPEPKSLSEVIEFADARPNNEDPKATADTPQQKEWAEKAVKRYAEAQEKKWQRWTQSMFEPAK